MARCKGEGPGGRTACGRDWFSNDPGDHSVSWQAQGTPWGKDLLAKAQTAMDQRSCTSDALALARMHPYEVQDVRRGRPTWL